MEITNILKQVRQNLAIKHLETFRNFGGKWSKGNARREGISVSSRGKFQTKSDVAVTAVRLEAIRAEVKGHESHVTAVHRLTFYPCP